MLPVSLTKPTWIPWGALTLPSVKPLSLALMPAVPVNCQGEPPGATW